MEGHDDQDPQARGVNLSARACMGRDGQEPHHPRTKALAVELAAELVTLLAAAVERAREPVPPPAPEPWMNTEQAAAHAGVTPETIRDWARRKCVRAGHVGRELRLRASDLDAYILGDEKPARAPDPERAGGDVHPRVLEILGDQGEGD